MGEYSLTYKNYVVRKFHEKVRAEVKPEIKSDIEVSYAALMKNNRRLLKLDGVYFSEGNDTQFGLFGLLGPGSEQIIVSQTVPRGGRHWVVRVTPDVDRKSVV